jgi:hypothetical protein
MNEEALREEFDIRPGETWEQAAARKMEENPDLKNICFLKGDAPREPNFSHIRTKSANEILSPETIAILRESAPPGTAYGESMADADERRQKKGLM